MPPDREAALAWEARWAKPAAAVTFVAVALAIGGFVLFQAIPFGDGDSELLRNIDERSNTLAASKALEAIGLGLLLVPLYYLFRAALARSENMRGQLVGVVFAGPLFLTIGLLLSMVSTLDAASEFVKQEVPRLMAEGVPVGSEEADTAASDLRTDSTLFQVSTGFQLGGLIGFLVAFFYPALHAMRTGLLTRFWGSLGMALAAVSIFPLFRTLGLAWFIYFGLLVAGLLPGGRPPAWETGRAMPWPTPGERAAGELERQPGEDPDEEPRGELEAPEGEDGEGEPTGPGGERRKRKRRG